MCHDQGEYHRVSAPGLHHQDCPGVVHSDELYFMWNPFYNVSYELHGQDVDMSNKMTTLWTNFAKTGDPNSPVDPDINIVWEKQTKDDQR